MRYAVNVLASYQEHLSDLLAGLTSSPVRAEEVLGRSLASEIAAAVSH